MIIKELIVTDPQKIKDIMKVKERVTKEQAALEKRRRRSNLEILRLPTGAMRLMKDIAASADLPVDRVFKDIIEAGLAVIRNPESSPYESMIQFRKTLHENSTRGTLAKGDNEKVDETTGRGGADQSVGDTEMAKGINAAPDTESIDDELGFIDNSKRSGDVDERPGQRATSETSDDITVGSVTQSSDSPSDDDSLEYVP